MGMALITQIQTASSRIYQLLTLHENNYPLDGDIGLMTKVRFK
jgi:hypothetical protein